MENTLMVLTPVQQAEYETCKEIMRQGMAICCIVGGAARTIKEKEYFRSEGFATWGDFVKSRYGWTRRYVDQLIIDADTINSLPEGLRKLITSHTAARELALIPESLRIDVVSTVSKKGKVTGAKIKKLLSPPNKSSGQKEPEKKKTASKAPPARKAATALPKVKDETGTEVPAESLAMWERGEEAHSLVVQLLSVRCRLKKFIEDRDPLFAEVDGGDDLAMLAKLIQDVRCATPYAVCHSCNGKTPAECTTCKGRGFVSEFFWKIKVPEEFRKMRGVK